jgi:hypothetical protein
MSLREADLCSLAIVWQRVREEEDEEWTGRSA